MDRFQIIKGEEPEPLPPDKRPNQEGTHIGIVLSGENFEADLYIIDIGPAQSGGLHVRSAEIYFTVENHLLTWPSFNALLNTEITFYPIVTFISRTNPRKMWVRGVSTSNISGFNGETIRRIKLSGRIT